MRSYRLHISEVEQVTYNQIYSILYNRAPSMFVRRKKMSEYRLNNSTVPIVDMNKYGFTITHTLYE